MKVEISKLKAQLENSADYFLRWGQGSASDDVLVKMLKLGENEFYIGEVSKKKK